MTNKTCNTCVHYALDIQECRRFPPVSHPFLVDNQTGQMEWSWSYPNLYPHCPACGEHQRTEELIPIGL